MLNLPAGTPAKTADRLVAVACAMSLTAPNVEAGASGTGSVTKSAATIERWLGELDPDDALIWRTLLLLVCEQAAEGTHLDRIKTFTRDLHRHITRR